MDNAACSSHCGIEESSLHDERSHGFTLVDSRKLEYANEQVPPPPPNDNSVALEDETVAGQTILASIDSNQQGTNTTTTPPSSTQAPLSIAPDELTLSDLAELTPPLVDEELPVPSEIITEQGDCGKLADESGDVEQADEDASLQDSSADAAASTQLNAKDDSSDHSNSTVRDTKLAPHPNKLTRGRRALACFLLLTACSSLWAAHRYYSSVGPDLVARESSVAIDVSRELVVVESGSRSQVDSSDVSQDEVSSNTSSITLQPGIDEEVHDAEIGTILVNESIMIKIENNDEGDQRLSNDQVARTQSAVHARQSEHTMLHFGLIGELDHTISNDEIPVDEAILLGNVTTLLLSSTVELTWLVALGAGIVLAFAVCACGQGNKKKAEEASPGLTPQQMCWIIEHCDGFVSRKGRRSSLVSAEPDHPFDVAAYNCLTKEDLQKVCQHLGMDLNCVTNRKKSWIVQKLVHCYASILDGYTNAEIAQVLTAKGLDFSLKMKRGELIKLAVEAAF